MKTGLQVERWKFQDSEADAWITHEKRADAAPLHERKDAQADYLTLLRDPETLQERTRWAIGGDYGYHGGYLIREAINNNRRNHHAMIGRVLGLYECSGCTGRMGADAWNKLNKAEQEVASAAIEAGIAESISLDD
jgi:hypothetical protein